MSVDGDSLVPLALGLFFLYVARGGEWGHEPLSKQTKIERRWTVLWYVLAVYFVLASMKNLFNLP